MHTFVLTTFVLCLHLLASAQQNQIVNVGVPPLLNRSTGIISPTLERDRLVRALNDLKPDKKTGLRIHGISLDGLSGDEITDEAARKRCDYVVYTTLVELRSAGEPAMPVPGTIQTNPNIRPGVQNPNNGPEYWATVDFKIYDLNRHSTIGGAPYSNHQQTEGDTVVNQIMDRIANNVWSEIRKGPPPPMHEE
jgi:hypothetical protein